MTAAASIPLGLAAAGVGYAVGGLPFGLLIGRISRNVDLRQHGSGRTGATNALRTLGPAAAAAVLVLDLVKGLAAVSIARLLLAAAGPEAAEWGGAAAGAAAVLGHVYSPFIGFRGGRGVATTTGALLALAPWAVLVVAPVVLLIAWRSRLMSLASLCGAALAPVVTAALSAIARAEPPDVAYTVVAGGVVFLAHRDNIARLRAGTERRIGERAETLDDG